MDQEWGVIIMMDFFSMLLARAGISGGGGGGGFTPTDEQLAAMDSGITAEKLQTDENNISSLQEKVVAHTAGGSNYDTINGIRVYVSSTAPTGDIPTGSIWIGG